MPPGFQTDLLYIVYIDLSASVHISVDLHTICILGATSSGTKIRTIVTKVKVVT